MCQNPAIFRILALFSDLKNSTCKYLYRPWKVPPFLLPRRSHRSAQLWMEKNAALRMACKGTYKWNFSVLKTVQNPGISRILVLFSDLRNSTCKYAYMLCEVPTFLAPRRPHRYLHIYGPKKFWDTACHFRVLKRGISQIRKKCQNPEDYGTFFRFAKFLFLVPLQALWSATMFFHTGVV
jgi:hypothetical protein